MLGRGLSLFCFLSSRLGGEDHLEIPKQARVLLVDPAGNGQVVPPHRLTEAKQADRLSRVLDGITGDVPLYLLEEAAFPASSSTFFSRSS